MEERKLTGYSSIDKPWLKYYSEEAINVELPEKYPHGCRLASSWQFMQKAGQSL